MRLCNRCRPGVALVVATCALISSAGCDTFFQAIVDQAVARIQRTGPDPGDPVYPPKEFVNWETPIDLTPNGGMVLVVNTPNNSLEVFAPTPGGLAHTRSIPVGLDPVSVRVRSSQQAWVVNHVSDSISIIDLVTLRVFKTLHPGDEPTDVGFAAGRAFVVCSQENQVKVYDLSNLDAAPAVVPIEGEDPRALAVSADGSRVYVAIFESGNATTIVPTDEVSKRGGPYNGKNPIPSPRYGQRLYYGAGLSTPRKSSLIVKKDAATGRWLDENGSDWSASVTWDLHDHDLAIIDTTSLAVSYVSGLMNLDMAVAELPGGVVTVVGTDATNVTRFEPVVRGRFIHNVLARFNPADGGKAVIDLNPHLAGAYAAEDFAPLAEDQRALAISEPRAIVWAPDGSVGYVAGMHSNNVARIDANGNRIAQRDVGQGPTGLRLDPSRNRLYVVNKFDATISIINTGDFTEQARVSMFDPTPAEIRAGRPFLYDARLTSGLGVTACASCHIDGRMDQLAWDLGDPLGKVKAFNQVCDNLFSGTDFFDQIVDMTTPCENFHPVKGPMTTQTLQGIIGEEPLHWRGDRDNLAEFNPAFEGLNGNHRTLTDDEMQKLTAFVASITYPPNPYRRIDNALREDSPFGDAVRGRQVFMTEFIDGRIAENLPFVPHSIREQGPFVTCGRCHMLPMGTSRALTPASQLMLAHSIKVPQLRNMHEKTGFLKTSMSNNRGFGYTHDGAFATLDEFLHFVVFDFDRIEDGAAKRQDVIAFLMSFSTDTHAGVGYQITLDATNKNDPATVALLDLMRSLADQQKVGLVVTGRVAGEDRGYAYKGNGIFQSDRAGDEIDAAALRAAAGAGNEQTWTLVPYGSAVRIGIDRNSNGILDGDE
jgi:DNA-binding beta-propeller fold protein YncE